MFLLGGEPWGPTWRMGVQDGGIGCQPPLVLRAPWAPGAVPQDLTDRCQWGVREHCTFCHELGELQQWISMVSQKLASHQEDAGPWDAQSREVEVEVRWLSRFPPLPPKMQAWEVKDPTWGGRRPLPRPLTVQGHVCALVCPVEAAG